MLLATVLVLAQTAGSRPVPTPAPAPDERAPEPTIVERIDDPPSGSPVPLSLKPPTPLPTPAPATPAPAPTPTPAPAAAPAKPASNADATGVFGVHVASYRKKETAEAEARRVGETLALPARVVRVELGEKGVWYRIVVGEAATAPEAAKLRDVVKAKGYPEALVVRSR